MAKRKTKPARLQVVSWTNGAVPRGLTQKDRDERTDAYLDWVIGILPRFDPHRDKKLDSGGECVFDYDLARKAIRLIETYCSHVKGFTGPLILEPWQHAVVGNLFGWIRPDGLRRFREFMLYVPRKNAKTTLAAAITIVVAVMDKEPGAELYGAAYTIEQARLVDDMVRGMVRAHPKLDERASMILNSVTFQPNTPHEAVFRKLPGKEKTAHGLNPHLALLDELHTQRGRELYDALHTGMGARRQPIMGTLTTADFARPSICNERLAYCQSVLDGASRDPALLPVIFAAGREDDWKAPKTWAKANPNLGVSVSEEYIRAKCKEAASNPSLENTFRRLHLNIQTEQADRWISVESWDACGADGVDPGDLIACGNAVSELERRCSGLGGCAGLDLAATEDLNAYCIAVPGGGRNGSTAFVWRFWIPDHDVIGRENRDNVPYRTWHEMGLLKLTPGKVADQDVIRDDIVSLRDDFGLGPLVGNPRQCLAYDAWGAAHLTQRLERDHRFDVRKFPQTLAHMSPAMKALAIAIGRPGVSQGIDHGHNPIARWMMMNLQVERDANDNIKPSKNKSNQRIDGVSAAVMAYGALLDNGNEAHGSAYNDLNSPVWDDL